MKYETENHSTNTTLSEETNTETICAPINNDSGIIYAKTNILI